MCSTRLLYHRREATATSARGPMDTRVALMAKVVWGEGTDPAEVDSTTPIATEVRQLGPTAPETSTPARFAPACGTQVALMAKAIPSPGAGSLPKQPAHASNECGVPSRGSEPPRRDREG